MDEYSCIEVTFFPSSQLKIGKKINEGYYGQVYRGSLRLPSPYDEDEEDEVSVAIKVPKRQPESLATEARSLL